MTDKKPPLRLTDEQRRAMTVKCRDVFVTTADKLAGASVPHVVIVEAGMSAVLQLNELVLGKPALVDWLRDAADHIEAGLLAEMSPPVIQ